MPPPPLTVSKVGGKKIKWGGGVGVKNPDSEKWYF